MTRKLADFAEFTDKENGITFHNEGTDEVFASVDAGAPGHRYCSLFYDAAFAPLASEPIRMLEVGVQYGGSLAMWSRFFVNAELILGIDVSVHKQIVEHPACVRIVHGNAYEKEFADTITGLFDIVIDDGSHGKDDQIKFLDLYFSKVKPGGWLVIEDICGGSLASLQKASAKLIVPYCELKDLRLPDDRCNGDANSILLVARKAA